MLNQDFHFGPGTATVYTRAAPNTTSFRAEPCTSPPPVGARARPSAHRRCLSGLNGAPADNAPCETFLEPKLLILTRATLPTRHRQRPDPSQHVAEQPPVQIPLGQQQPVMPRVLDQPTSGLHQPVLQARQRPTLDPVRQSEPSPQVAQVVGQHAELEFLPQALEEWIALNERPRLRPARHPHRRSPAVPSTGK